MVMFQKKYKFRNIFSLIKSKLFPTRTLVPEVKVGLHKEIVNSSAFYYNHKTGKLLHFNEQYIIYVHYAKRSPTNKINSQENPLTSLTF
jgi:hypothetical protein